MLCHYCGTKYGKVLLKEIKLQEGKCKCCARITNVADERVYGYPHYPGNTLSSEVRSILKQSLDFIHE
jgi:hypothetical protein